MKRFSTIVMATLCLIFTASVKAQPRKKLTYHLDSTGTSYVTVGFCGQIWARWNQSNPGTTLFGQEKDHTFDVGLRRWRITAHGQINKKASVFIQFGQNNFHRLSTKERGAFFHDGVMTYDFCKAFSLGGGLFGWSGPSRYAAPSIANLLALDAPLYQQATNGISDQFLRKIGLFTKGTLQRFEYRAALTVPMSITTGVETSPNQMYAVFNPTTSSLQPQAYVKYQVFEMEGTKGAYAKSTYLGTRKVLAIGAGFVQQKEAMWSLTSENDTITHPMLQLGFDVFWENPLPKNRAVTLYSAFHVYDFGPSYLRNIGVMNPADGSNATTTINGRGNGYPTLGTGTSFFTQLGYLHPYQKRGLQPYIAIQVADYEGLKELMTVWDIGANLLLTHSQHAKFSIGVQNRPIFEGDHAKARVASRKNMIVAQMQLSF